MARDASSWNRLAGLLQARSANPAQASYLCPFAFLRESEMKNTSAWKEQSKATARFIGYLPDVPKRKPQKPLSIDPCPECGWLVIGGTCNRCHPPDKCGAG